MAIKLPGARDNECVPPSGPAEGTKFADPLDLELLALLLDNMFVLFELLTC